MRIGRDFAILIIEDHALIAADVEDVARQLGATLVGSTARLPNALTLLEATPWDIALVDVNLTNGVKAYPVADRLLNKGIPFAFLTAADEEIEPQYLGTPVLRKPFGVSQLESCLQALLRVRASQARQARTTIINIPRKVGGPPFALAKTKIPKVTRAIEIGKTFLAPRRSSNAPPKN
jgi:DNA-binding response OmpR family regulator